MVLERLALTKMASLSTDIHAQYIGAIWKKLATGLVILIALCAVFVFSLGVGFLSISARDILTALFGGQNSEFNHVIWNIRLTRAVGAVLAGAGLGVSGAIMQNVLKNPLASPFTIGVSQGAAFGAAFAIIILGAGQTHMTGNELVTIRSPYVVATSAFIGSLMTVCFILALSSLRRVTPESIILAGVALSAFFGAATMFLQYFASDVQVASSVFWTFGDIGKAGCKENIFMLIAFILPFIYFFIVRWSFNALQWGDEVAETLGVNVKRLRVLSMVLSSMVVATITSFLGIIGFIGLIAPHIVRFMIGSDYRFLIPYSAIFGALLLLTSDILARTIMPPVILPVGIVTSFAGAPMFLYLLVKSRRV